MENNNENQLFFCGSLFIKKKKNIQQNDMKSDVYVPVERKRTMYPLRFSRFLPIKL